MRPQDLVAVGQSFELNYEPGSLFVVEHVTRRWNDFHKRETWNVRLLCVVPPPRAYHAGQKVDEFCLEGTLRTAGYKRLA